MQVIKLLGPDGQQIIWAWAQKQDLNWDIHSEAVGTYLVSETKEASEITGRLCTVRKRPKSEETPVFKEKRKQNQEEVKEDLRRN